MTAWAQIPEREIILPHAEWIQYLIQHLTHVAAGNFLKEAEAMGSRVQAFFFQKRM